MTKQPTLKQIADYLGVTDLKLTTGKSGRMYTAKSPKVDGRMFVAWDKEHLREVARGLYEGEDIITTPQCPRDVTPLEKNILLGIKP